MSATVIFFKSSNSFEQPVVGESSYQSAIKKTHESEGKVIDVDLQLEDENQFDKNAVMVAFGMDTLGYLPREDAVIYRNALQKLGHPRAVGVCKAKIIGGNGRHYGIIIDIDIAEPQVEKVSVPNPQAQPQLASSSNVPPVSKATVLPKPAAKNIFFKNVREFWGKGLINKVVLLIAVFFITCSFFSCLVSLFSPGTSAQPTQDINAVSTNAMLTAWAPFTQTAEAYTPTPSSTPLPTNTPIPTVTNTPLPQPVTLSGNGDSVVDVPWDGPGILTITHNGGGNFAIQSYDANNNYMDLLVNTIGNYQGTVPLDLLDREDTARFQITAGGSWQIVVSPLISARAFELPAVITGVGDDVVIIRGGNADTVAANNQGNSNFAVWSYSGSGRDLVFNEIAPYTGTALLKSDTFLLVIVAQGDWTLDISTR